MSVKIFTLNRSRALSALAPLALIEAVRQTWRDQVIAKFMDRYRLFS